MRGVRFAAAGMGTALTVAGAAGVGAHFVGSVSAATTLTASFTPLLVVVALVAAVLFAIAGPRWAALPAALVTAVGVASQYPLYQAAAAAGTEPPATRIRLLQANIELGSADAAALVERVRTHDIDVLTVIELTDSAVGRLADAGLHDLLPQNYLRPRNGGGGAGVYARNPLRDGALLPGLHLNNVRATMTTSGGRDVAVYALHPHPPYPGPVRRWASDLHRLQEIFAQERLPMIVGADVNATYDHRRYRELLARSTQEGSGPLLDAAEYLGAGVVATYPADRWYPAVLAIDRILTRGGVPLSFRRVEVPGSDHHGVIGDIGLGERRS